MPLSRSRPIPIDCSSDFSMLRPRSSFSSSSRAALQRLCQLGVAAQARPSRHARCGLVGRAWSPPARSRQSPPALHEPFGARVGVEPHPALLGHRARRAASVAPAACPISPDRGGTRIEVARGIGPHLVQRLAGRRNALS
jgi:hypothetical protein